MSEEFDYEVRRDIDSLVKKTNYRDWVNLEDKRDQQVAKDFRATPVARHEVKEGVSESVDGLPVKDRDLIEGGVDSPQLGDDLSAERSRVEVSGEVTNGALGVSSNSSSVPQGNVRQVLAWVDGDADKAQEALEAENAKESPRKSLVSQLEEVIGE